MYEVDQPNWTIRLILTAVLCMFIGAGVASVLWAHDEAVMQAAFQAHVAQDQAHIAEDNARAAQLQRNLQQLREKYAQTSADVARLQAEQQDHPLQRLAETAKQAVTLGHLLHVAAAWLAF